LFAILVGLPCIAQQGAPAPAANNPVAAADPVAAAQEALRAAEAAHPGNTVEVAKALDDAANAAMDEGVADAGTLETTKREMTVAEAAAGPRSKLFVKALTITSRVLVEVNQASEGRAQAERAMEIAKAEFPDAEEFGRAADAVAGACESLGDWSCSMAKGCWVWNAPSAWRARAMW
jgi:hypothetical protein